MIILSKGWKLPQAGDFGDVWFPALEFNINQLDSHSHNGIDSQKIGSINIVATVVTVPSASFVTQIDGSFKAPVTIPAGSLIDTLVITIKDPTTKDEVFLKVAKTSPTTFDLSTNFVQDFEVYFGV